MILVGDCRELMAEMDAASVDAVVTDPPYELGFMGKGWDKAGVAFDAATWRECLRVLKPGGHLLAFGGTRTFHRMTVAIEDAGFEIKDCLSWLYGQGFPKHRSLLKPGWEPIVLARKRGAGALNIDACRIKTDDVLVRPDIPRRGNQVFGKGLGSGVQCEPSGRWPANVVLDEDAAALLDEQSGVSKSTGGGFRAKGADTRNGIYGAFGDRTLPPDVGLGDTGGASRFFYCAKASRAERNAGLDGMPGKKVDRYGEQGQGPTPQQTPRVTRIEANHHPTVKPVALMRWLVRLVTPPDGLVLDPFAGSGSTGVACAHEGVRFIGIEQNEEYAEIARRRIGAVNPLFAMAAD